MTGVSRRELIAVTGAGALASVLASCGDDSAAATETSRFGEGDVGVLNYLLLLEYLAAAFYADAAGSGLFEGRELRTIREFGSQEEEHVTTLTKALERAEGQPIARPRTRFPRQDAHAILELGATLENLTAAAYLGQVPIAEGKRTLATLLSIHSIEGSHAAALKILLGQPFTPEGPFAKPATATSVLKKATPYMPGGF